MLLKIFSHLNPWLTMMLWQVTIWALVIAGILALRRHR